MVQFGKDAYQGIARLRAVTAQRLRPASLNLLLAACLQACPDTSLAADAKRYLMACAAILRS